MLDKILGLRTTAPTQPRSHYYAPMRNVSGVAVNEETALTYSAVFSAVKVITETVGLLPWRHYEERGPSRYLLPGSPVDLILHQSPNAEMTPFQFREYLLACALLHGNGYAEIEFDRGGHPIGLWTIHPSRVKPKRTAQGSLYYEVQNAEGGQGTTDVPMRQMYHLRGPTSDGIVGRSVIALARGSFGLALATEQFAGAFFGNGGVPGLVIQASEGSPSRSKEAVENLLESFQKRHGGPAKAGKPAYLEPGDTIETVGINHKDAQFIEGRKFNVSEVARWFRVPPHKIGDLEKATFSNIESQETSFVMDAILPWTVRMEQEANKKLAPGTTLTKMKVLGLMRGDSKARGEYYKTMRDLGALDINEIRALEDMNPIDGGDLRLVPMNMMSLDRASATGGTDPASAAQAVLSEAHHRLAVKEDRAALRAIESGKDLSEWAAGFYDRHEAQLAAALQPGADVFAALSGVDPEAVAGAVAGHVADVCQGSRGLLAAGDWGANPVEAKSKTQTSRLVGRLRGMA